MWWNAVMFFSFLCICNLFYVTAGKDVQQDKYIRKVKKDKKKKKVTNCPDMG